MNVLPAEKQTAVVAALTEGVSVRAAERLVREQMDKDLERRFTNIDEAVRNVRRKGRYIVC